MLKLWDLLEKARKTESFPNAHEEKSIYKKMWIMTLQQNTFVLKKLNCVLLTHAI